MSFYGADTPPYLHHRKNSLEEISPMYLQCPWQLIAIRKFQVRSRKKPSSP